MRTRHRLTHVTVFSAVQFIVYGALRDCIYKKFGFDELPSLIDNGFQNNSTLLTKADLSRTLITNADCAIISSIREKFATKTTGGNNNGERGYGKRGNNKSDWGNNKGNHGGNNKNDWGNNKNDWGIQKGKRGSPYGNANNDHSRHKGQYENKNQWSKTDWGKSDDQWNKNDWKTENDWKNEDYKKHDSASSKDDKHKDAGKK